MSAAQRGKDLDLVSQILVRLRESVPHGLKPAFFAGWIGTAEEAAEKHILAASGAKTLAYSIASIAALKALRHPNPSFLTVCEEAVPSLETFYEDRREEER